MRAPTLHTFFSAIHCLSNSTLHLLRASPPLGPVSHNHIHLFGNPFLPALLSFVKAGQSGHAPPLSPLHRCTAAKAKSEPFYYVPLVLLLLLHIWLLARRKSSGQFGACRRSASMDNHYLEPHSDPACLVYQQPAAPCHTSS